jgi:tellurite resistance protein TehA-like permease
MLSRLDQLVSYRDFLVRNSEAVLTLFEAQLGSQTNVILPPNFLGTEHSVEITKIIALLVALWFWGLSMWFFLVSVGSLWKYVRTRRGMPFQMTWWSFVFPNTALVSTSYSFSSITLY